MNTQHTYHITLSGQHDAEAVNANSPLNLTLDQAGPTSTEFRVATDQSGIVGLLRHLHGRGFVLLAIDHAPPAHDVRANRGVSRRQFLKTGLFTLGVMSVTAYGVTIATPDPIQYGLPAFNFGDETMNTSLLVTYATSTGSTIDVAAAIGKTLGERGFAVDVRPIEESPSPEGYAAVVIGSAVQYGKWLPEAIAYVKANQPALNAVPVALFCVHIQNDKLDAESTRRRLAYLDSVRALVTPVDEGFFMGRFNRSGAKQMLPGFIARLIPPLDFRNWDKIHAWAGDLAAKLQVTAISGSRAG